MTDDFNLGRLLLEQCRKQPEALAIRSPQYQITYGQLGQMMVAFALHMQERGIGRGARVGLWLDDQIANIVAVGANMLLGSTFIRATHVVLKEPRLGLTHLLHTPMPNFPTAQGVYCITADWMRPPAGSAQKQIRFPLYASPEDVMYISTTSGSTGMPKFVAQPIQRVAARVRRGHHVPVHNLVNLFHPASGGVSLNFHVLLAGGTLDLSRDFRSWLKNGVDSVQASPRQIFKILPQGGNPDGHRIPVAFMRGAHTTKEMRDFLFQFFDRLRIGFGSSEATGICQRIVGRDEPYDPALGPLLPGAVVEVVDEAGNPLPAGEEGRLRVRSPHMATGYLFNPEATAQSFRDGWFYPGDIAKLDETGQLVIIGRANDQFSLGGVKVNAQALDEVILADPRIDDAASFVFPGLGGLNALGLLVVPVAGVDNAILAADLRTRCRAEMGKSRVPERIHIGIEIPRNENGKVQRQEVARVAEGFPGF